MDEEKNVYFKQQRKTLSSRKEGSVRGREYWELYRNLGMRKLKLQRATYDFSPFFLGLFAQARQTVLGESLPQENISFLWLPDNGLGKACYCNLIEILFGFVYPGHSIMHECRNSEKFSSQFLVRKLQCMFFPQGILVWNWHRCIGC